MTVIIFMEALSINFKLGGFIFMLRLLFHLFMTSITGGLWLVVLLIDFLVNNKR